ncbi:fimbria/pilus periplasmic chaperone [Escherichia alba]|jgi:P pilus assembly chaperone PapD|uniref:Fimbria/pilus periplasmic chaperone n=2 Tax=Intestinirhabdus alba TaxID=2899544 RepID=A0A6L6IHE5_9ENTR|nr:molecular chaperone [Intestinirhabdus alba]MTH45505.1 fimbria/pilus periplasmic chaperone [Intestinirhabdus alba]
MKCLTGLVLSFLMIASSPVLAGVVMGGTRVIYPQNTREVAFSVTNMENSTPYLIQSWVENYDRRNKSQPPFIVTPPLFRLDPEQTNTLRIRYTGAPLPTDRESVFWLNVKSISPKPKDGNNELQINIKSKFKIFFRPTGLGNGAETAWKKLTVSRTGSGVTINNPTPWYVSFHSLKVAGKSIPEPGMIGPGERRELPGPATGNVTWTAINDFGGITPSFSQHY